MTTLTKTIRKPDKTVQFPVDNLKELLIAHLYATSYLNDDQEVADIVFKSGVDMKNALKFDIYFKKTK